VLGFNALKYSSYYTCNLNNAEFFFANGTIATSWLEGNIINEMTANSACTSSSSHNSLVDSANVLYWVLDPSKYFLPANTGTQTYNTIYLGWAGNVISPSNTLLSNTLTGEAPQLSCAQPWNTIIGCGSGTSSYGYYDNGNMVFNANGLGLYQNFIGTNTPSGWTKTDPSGQFTQDNGVILNAKGATVPSANLITISTNYGLNPNQILDTLASSSAVNGGDDASGPGYMGINDLGGGYGFKSVSWQLSGLSQIAGSAYTTGPTISAVYKPPNVNTKTNDVLTIYWPSTSTASFYDNYNALDTGTITSSIPTTNLAIGIEWSSGNAVGHVQWIRSRAYPPNGAMPTVTYGIVG